VACSDCGGTGKCSKCRENAVLQPERKVDKVIGRSPIGNAAGSALSYGREPVKQLEFKRDTSLDGVNWGCLAFAVVVFLPIAIAFPLGGPVFLIIAVRAALTDSGRKKW